jgi:serine/threonine protein kinase
LGAAHESRIIHGDIKPDNIMLTPAKRVKILDFGVARRFTNAEANDATLSAASMTASLSGTPAYMAPEVLKQKPYDGRADLFSLGLTFYEMLGGKQPFQADSFAGTLAQVLHAEVPSLSEVNRKVPAPVAGLVAKLLVKDPDARYASAQILLGDLRQIQQGGKPSVAFVDQRHRLRVLRTRMLRWGIAVAIAVLLLTYRPVRRLWAPTGTQTESVSPVLSQDQNQNQIKSLPSCPFRPSTAIPSSPPSARAWWRMFRPN